MADRLRGATSPYLLQHAGNPVDWWPWSDAAFAEAARRDVPVMLSVGYSACHWCHVMAHESFEDEQTAALMNEHLVSIKVDREERPDVDAVYMTATQAMTGQGGWPMTVFMTPDKEPFFCGTYFPRTQFQRLIMGVTRAWKEDRSQVTGQASQIAAALAGQASARPAASAGPAASARMAAGAGPYADDLAAADPLRATCDGAVAGLAHEFDASRGGFGGAPKFPPSMVLEFLLRHAARAGGGAHAGGSGNSGEAARGGNSSGGNSSDGGSGGSGSGGSGSSAALALQLATVTADAMARGGMYDQLAGGFARYSVDADWVIPHFEKMLYDNALLARVYAHLWRQTGSALARRAAEQTCEWMLAELRTAEGGFASALDADSDGAEGAFYVWTPDQLAAALGEADGGWAAATFGVTPEGTFEHSASVLQLRADPADAARMATVRSALLAARAHRTRPGRDDKVVAGWNGLAIAALAEAGLLFGRADFIAAATAAADLLARVHVSAGRLARTSRDGRVSLTAGVLDDYGCVAEGLIALASVTSADDAAAGPAGRWLELAGKLLETALDRFGDGAGGFYDTADDSEQLIYRPSDLADGPSPSGTFATAGSLLSYSALTGSVRHRDAALAALDGLTALAARFPRAAGWGLAVAEAAISGPVEIAIVGPPGPERAQLHLTAHLAAPPGAVIACGPAASRVEAGAGSEAVAGVEAGAGDDAGAGSEIPLLAGRTVPDGGIAAGYVCRGFVCRAPVINAERLRAELS